jgi:hypothetical protein
LIIPVKARRIAGKDLTRDAKFSPTLQALAHRTYTNLTSASYMILLSFPPGLRTVGARIKPRAKQANVLSRLNHLVHPRSLVPVSFGRPFKATWKPDQSQAGVMIIGTLHAPEGRRRATRSNCSGFRRLEFAQFRGSEVNDDVGCSDDSVFSGIRNSEILISIEREGIQGLVVGNLGPDLDLRQERVLPTDTGLDVARLGARALPLIIIDEFRAVRNIVERRGLVVQIHQRRLKIGRAAQDSRALAKCAARRVERHVLRRERGAAGVNDGDGYRRGIVQVGNITLVLVVGFNCDVPIVVELEPCDGSI